MRSLLDRLREVHSPRVGSLPEPQPPEDPPTGQPPGLESDPQDALPDPAREALRNRLRRLHRTPGDRPAPQATDPAPRAPGRAQEPVTGLARWLKPGTWRRNRDGALVLHELLPLHTPWGHTSLQACLTPPPLIPPVLEGIPIHRMGFLDLETTGLSPARGALAFLLGVGTLHPDGLHLHRVLLEKPRDEAAVWKAFSALLQACDALVTFNGTTFDIPFCHRRLESCGLHDLSAGLHRLVHLDLLPLARQRLQPRPQRFRLPAVEAHLLGYERHGDVPGSEAPARWARWMDSGDGAPLLDLIHHHRTDIATLPLILHALSSATATTPQHPNTKAPATATAPQHPGPRNPTVRATEHAPARPPALRADPAGWRAIRTQAEDLQRAGHWRDAAACWEQMSRMLPTDAGCRLALADLWQGPLDEPAKALPWLEEASRLVAWDGSVRRRLLDLRETLAAAPARKPPGPSHLH